MTNVVDLFSEQDAESKVIVPTLQALGYVESDPSRGVTYRFQHSITVQQGRDKKIIRADVVVFVHGTPVIVVDAKNPRKCLTENDKEQVISYARLVENVAPYAALSNGHTWQVFNTLDKQQIRGIPPYDQLLRDIQARRLSARQREILVSQATRTLFAIESVRDLSRLMRRCHDVIRNLKGYDPTRAFDELSKLLFAKMFEEKEVAEGRRTTNRFTIENILAMREQGVEIIQTLWKDTVTSPRYREIFSDDEIRTGIDLPSEAIDQIVGMLQDKSLGLTDLDVKGIAFEEFLASTYRGGGLGQYFTPREVVSFMVDLVDPAIGERIIDPSCGSGGFLIRAYDVVSQKIKTSELSDRDKGQRLRDLASNCLVGIDWEARAARTCKMNMIIHGDGHAGVYHANALDIDELAEKVQERRRYYSEAPDVAEESFDIVLANPPFGARDSLRRILNHYETGKNGAQKREVLMLERCIRLLRPGGRLAIVLPEGILSNKGDQHIRKYLTTHCDLKAVIRLPQDAFKMSEGAACTSIVYATKREFPRIFPDTEQKEVFFARAEYIGISPSGKPIDFNGLPAVREEFRIFEQGKWSGIRLSRATAGGSMSVFFSKEEQRTPWLELQVNRTSLLYDRLRYVVESPWIDNRFSYTFHHPSFFQVTNSLRSLPIPVPTLEALCVPGYPVRGRKPPEESSDGVPILKVRNVTGRGLDMDTDYVPDDPDLIRGYQRGLILKDDILITSTGEGTIGRVDTYPFDEPAFADGHIAICRLREGISVAYVAEFLRSEMGQVQMLRYVSGSTGQTELLIDYVRNILVPLPENELQNDIVTEMNNAHERSLEFIRRSTELRKKSAFTVAEARAQMLKALANAK